jgi:hypothetical protein
VKESERVRDAADIDTAKRAGGESGRDLRSEEAGNVGCYEKGFMCQWLVSYEVSCEL